MSEGYFLFYELALNDAIKEELITGTEYDIHDRRMMPDYEWGGADYE